jgi:hypothetical protein
MVDFIKEFIGKWKWCLYDECKMWFDEYDRIFELN